MNWTGGGLSRSRFAKGSLTAKQKNYFAKARAKLQHGRPPPPPDIKFYEFGEWFPERKAVDFSPPQAKTNGSSPVQKTLDQFEATKPLAKRLGSLRARQEPRKRKRTPLQEAADQRQPQRPKLDPSEPIVIGSSPSSSSVSSRGSPAPRRRPPPRSSSDDILSAPSIEAKRRRLLEMDDWVGVDLPAMKPVKMKFADPADTDLIGKRRSLSKVNYRHSSDQRRPMARAPLPVRRHYDIPKAAIELYPEGDISVRIGSAVDRSDGRASIRDEHRLSVLSDELLDGEASQSANKLPRPVPVFNTPGPTPLRFSDHSQREVLTPSAFMDDSSSNPSISNRVDRPGRHRQSSSPIRGPDKYGSNGVDELYEWAKLEGEKERAPMVPGPRFVFDETPRPHGPRRGAQGSSPMIPDFASLDARNLHYPLKVPTTSPDLQRGPWNNVRVRDPGDHKHAKTETLPNDIENRAGSVADVTPRLTTAAPKNPGTGVVQSDPIHSDPKVENLAVITPPSAMASAQVLTEFYDRVSSNMILERNMTRKLDGMEKHFARMTGKPLPRDIEYGNGRAIEEIEWLPQNQPRSPSVVRRSMQIFSNMDSGEGKPSLLQESYLPTTTDISKPRAADRPLSNNLESNLSLQRVTKEKETKQAAEDEEAAWRKIVFGDENEDDEYTLEDPEAPFHPASSRNHPRTQPSVLAEAATSPLKQNPHLADSTFDDSPAFGNGTQIYTNYSPTNDSIDHYATTTNSNMTAQNVPIGSSPSPSLQPRLPRTLVRNPTSSSLLGEASMPSLQNNPASTISSDELQRPFEPLPRLSDAPPAHTRAREQSPYSPTEDPTPSSTPAHGHGNNHLKEKVLFKRPSRYVGAHSSDPLEPVVLGGRMLRSGRRVSAAAGGKDVRGSRRKQASKRRGSGRGRGKEYEARQVEEVAVGSDDDDDDDEIVDD